MTNDSKKSHTKFALSLASIALGMVMLSFAAVPLYDLFCRVTGYGGTTAEASTIPDEIGEREFIITFNADIHRDLPWKFKPTEKKLTLKVGENRLTTYEAWSETDIPTKGMALYNVTPHAAGPYFNKVQCFCFEEQTLNGGEHVTMPISFFIDPEINNDPELDNIKTITLSYSFFAKDNK